MHYIESSILFTIFDLAGEDDRRNCAEISSICDLMTITLPNQSLRELYRSFHDYTAASYFGDPTARIGRGDLFIFMADVDQQSFLTVDMFNSATDQMNTVTCGVRCDASLADSVATNLRSLHDRSEITGTALLNGSLGLMDLLDLSKYPRCVNNDGQSTMQHVAVYRFGALQATSRKS